MNLMRLLAAALVVATHAFGLTGNTPSEPIGRLFGIGAGDLGVDVFFVLSGFLVSKSLAGRTLLEFIWARCARILPGLWAATIVSVLVAGAFFSDQKPGQFLTSVTTLSYVAHNFTMLPGIGEQQDLPHAFGAGGDPRFNVPLWTLPHELQMYMLLALVAVTLGLRARYVAVIAIAGAAAVALDKGFGLHTISIERGRFLYFFFAGSLAYALRERIVLTSTLAAPLAIAVVLVALLGLPVLMRQAALALALPYLLLWFAYVPAGYLHLWNRLGDYSYGVYIYAFPVQRLLVDNGATTPLANFCLAIAIVLPIACLSWHLIEQRVLRIKPPRSDELPIPAVELAGAQSAQAGSR